MNAFSWERFRAMPLVGILRGLSADAAEEAALAAMRGGLRNIEVTMNSERATELIASLCAKVGTEMNVGAGTVCTLEELERALDAGASFIVTPIIVPQVIRACKAHGVPIFPGAFTPSEIFQAWQCGADMVKVFPADNLGPAFIKNVKAPLPQIPLLPTGGVTVETLGDFKRAGADGFGIGSPLFNPAKIREADWAWIEAQAGRFVQAYHNAS